MHEVYEFLIDKLALHDSDKIVVAVSGGPDSMALLHLLIEVRKQKKIEIICAHIHHNIRKESDFEKQFVEDYCKKNKILFEYMKIEQYNKNNFHKDAREKRYHYFESIVEKYHAKYLFTAHHGDDLIETMLMRIVRGSNRKGYGGFERITDRKTYQIVRPFITITKEDILTYIKKNDLTYVTDVSNFKDVYTRNRFRHYILPSLKKENKNVHQKFYKLSKMLFECSEYIRKIALVQKEKIYIKNTLYIEPFQKEEQIIQKEILSLILEEIYKEKVSMLTDKHIENLFHLIYSSKANAEICLPNHTCVQKTYNEIHFTFLKKQEGYKMKLENDVLLPNGHEVRKIEDCEENSNFICRLNSNDLDLPLYIRTRKIGDRISLKGTNGTRKIKDIFIDYKIHLNERNMWPIVTDAKGNIIWLPGLKKSKFDKSKEEKYDIILKYY